MDSIRKMVTSWSHMWGRIRGRMSNKGGRGRTIGSVEKEHVETNSTRGSRRAIRVENTRSLKVIHVEGSQADSQQKTNALRQQVSNQTRLERKFEWRKQANMN